MAPVRPPATTGAAGTSGRREAGGASVAAPLRSDDAFAGLIATLLPSFSSNALEEAAAAVATEKAPPPAKKLQDAWWAAAAYVCSGAIAINAAQLLAAPLSALSSAHDAQQQRHTKATFSLLTTTATQLWAPTTLLVSGDASMRGQLSTDPRTGDLICAFAPRLVLIANHQLYTDWLYLWFSAFAAGRHGDVHIVLKESLRRLPFVGWGMQLSRFIFVQRRWAADAPVLRRAMRALSGRAPMWLLLFPEGTNAAASTRAASAAWAARCGVRDTQHVLLPRAAGLRLCLGELRGSVEWVYDCTVAYAGVARGAFAHDVYPLPHAYLAGRAPRLVSMHWRRFRVADIPLADERAFERWLVARWREKDGLIERWYRNGGRFADADVDRGVELGPRGELRRGAGLLHVKVRTSRWRDFVQVLAPIAALLLVLVGLLAALPADVLGVLAAQARRVLGEKGVGGEEGEGTRKRLLAFTGAGFAPVDAPPRTPPSTAGESRGLAAAAAPLASAAQGRARRSATQSERGSGPAMAPHAARSETSGKRLLGYADGRFAPVATEQAPRSSGRSQTRAAR